MSASCLNRQPRCHKRCSLDHKIKPHGTSMVLREEQTNICDISSIFVRLLKIHRLVAISALYEVNNCNIRESLRGLVPSCGGFGVNNRWGEGKREGLVLP